MLIFRRVSEEQYFAYHWRCSRTRLTHLIFADDLLLFYGSSTRSVQIFSQALKDFSLLSGLTPSSSKSCSIIAGSNQDYRSMVQNTFGFPLGSLPIRYLGVPLISTRLAATDCIPMVERITSRIKSWTSSFLSFAGHLQLIQSVIMSIQSYWMSLFIIPQRVINQVKAIMRAFLWKGPDLGKGGARVAWEDVSQPKEEGGLGIRKLHDWNKALMARCIWNICGHDYSSNWAVWARANLLRGRSFWDIPIPRACSWTKRKILNLKNEVCPFFRSSIGNGQSTFLWFDYWLPLGPIYPLFGDGVILDIWDRQR